MDAGWSGRICDNREPMTSMSLSPQAHATPPMNNKPTGASALRIVWFPSANNCRATYSESQAHGRARRASRADEAGLSAHRHGPLSVGRERGYRTSGGWERDERNYPSRDPIVHYGFLGAGVAGGFGAGVGVFGAALAGAAPAGAAPAFLSYRLITSRVISMVLEANNTGV
jgi:hypothetical protein